MTDMPTPGLNECVNLRGGALGSSYEKCVLMEHKSVYRYPPEIRLR